MYATECEWLSEGMEVSPLLPLCSCWDWNYVMATALARRDLSPRGSWKHFPSPAVCGLTVSAPPIAFAVQLRLEAGSDQAQEHIMEICMEGESSKSIFQGFGIF